MIFPALVAASISEAPILPLDDENPAVGGPWYRSNNLGNQGDEETWISSLENLYQVKFERNLDNLAERSYVEQIPWSGPYWPTYLDGINYKWNGPNSDSPVQKYAKAYNMNATDLADKMSRTNGIDRYTNLKACRRKSDCGDSNTECAIREGSSSGVCIPFWWGLCHAWAPAAILEKQPKCPVEHNGVTFEPMDLKALITALYDKARIGTVFTGRRCSQQDPKVDEQGRYRDSACRDLSPHFFHLAVKNLLKAGKSFVVDVSANADVWNQPTGGYRIMEKRDLSVEDALKNYFPGSKKEDVFSEKAKSLVKVVMKFSYTVESNSNDSGPAGDYLKSRIYEYILELDENRNIVGGEWISNSKKDHVDFLWAPANKPYDSYALYDIQYSEVKALIEKSSSASC